MAQQLKEFPRPARRGPNARDRWDKYLDGKIWSVSLEETGSSSFASMRSSMSYAALVKGLKVRTQQVDEEHLAVQAYDGG